MTGSDSARSEAIAGLAGPLLVAVAVAMLLNRQALPVLAGQLAQDYAVVFLSGAVMFVAGLAIVRVHNIWSGWPVLVTLTGWLAIVGGLVRMLFFHQLSAVAPRLVESPGVVIPACLLVLLVGAVLTLKGYRLIG